VTVTCDNCEKVYEPDDVAMGPIVLPIEWIQVSLPGETQQREFCTVKCMVEYQEEAVKKSG
jgi:hypothetical protein